MKHLTLLTTLAVALLGAGSSLRADEQADLNKQIKTLNDTAKTTEGQRRVLDSISAATGVPAATLTQERAAGRLGFGELTIAHLLATASGKTYDQIVAEFKSGTGWGKIANENNVKLGDIANKAHASAEAAEHGKGDNGKGDHGPGNHGPGGGPGKGHGKGR